jgi:chaperonin GroEL (HSP60 family)
MSDSTPTPQSVLLNNLNTIKSIADAVRGTFGPEGLDVMLIDQFGDYTVTNDGVKILSLIETQHPAAKMLIEAAQTQEEEVGDGTTTVTILVDAILSEAVQQIEKGVPIPKLIEGIKLALGKAQTSLKQLSTSIPDINDPKLESVALVSGRGEEELVSLVLQAAKEIGVNKLISADFKFAKMIIGKNQAESQLIHGVILNKGRTNPLMPSSLQNAKVMVFADALAPEELPQEAIGTEQGFTQFKHNQGSFLTGIKKIIDLGVKLVLVDSNLHPYAEELFVQAGIMAVQRVRSSELYRAANYCGANVLSRRSLNLAEEELGNYLGHINQAQEDAKLGIICLEGGKGEGMSTLIIGASTEAGAAEKERIASDVASAIQAALQGGVVSGGGSAEIALIPFLEELKKEQSQSLSLSNYGIDCLIEALKKPLAQICTNLGFNPLEKVAQVLSSQSSHKDFTLGINAKNGEVASMLKLGIVDPTLVKSVALKSSCEVASQILKVNVIIKSKQID